MTQVERHWRTLADAASECAIEDGHRGAGGGVGAKLGRRQPADTAPLGPVPFPIMKFLKQQFSN